jgi:hypothetical protein
MHCCTHILLQICLKPLRTSSLMKLKSIHSFCDPMQGSTFSPLCASVRHQSKLVLYMGHRVVQVHILYMTIIVTIFHIAEIKSICILECYIVFLMHHFKALNRIWNHWHLTYAFIVL